MRVELPAFERKNLTSEWWTAYRKRLRVIFWVNVDLYDCIHFEGCVADDVPLKWRNDSTINFVQSFQDRLLAEVLHSQVIHFVVECS